MPNCRKQSCKKALQALSMLTLTALAVILPGMLPAEAEELMVPGYLS